MAAHLFNVYRINKLLFVWADSSPIDRGSGIFLVFCVSGREKFSGRDIFWISVAIIIIGETTVMNGCVWFSLVPNPAELVVSFCCLLMSLLVFCLMTPHSHVGRCICRVATFSRISWEFIDGRETWGERRTSGKWHGIYFLWKICTFPAAIHMIMLSAWGRIAVYRHSSLE